MKPGSTTYSVLALALTLASTGIATLLPANVSAQSIDMSERIALRQFEERLDRVRRQADKMEKVVVGDWKPASKKKEHRYRNAMHEQLDELQQKARSEKRRLSSGASGMFATKRERNADYRDLEYTLRQMENQVQLLQKQVDKIEAGQRATDD